MNLVDNVLNKLLADKSPICVSILLPAHPTMAGRKPDVVLIHRIMQQLTNELQSRTNKDMAAALINKVERLSQEMDPDMGEGGTGIFVSEENEMLYHFDVPVEQKLVIGDSFRIRDLILQRNYADKYLVLQISHKGVHLYNGVFDDLVEIKDEKFPKFFEDNFEYQPPSRGSSYVGNAFTKQYEKDKGFMEERRFVKFLKEVDELLSGYLEMDMRLIVAGEIEHLSWFNAGSRYLGNVAGQLAGSYDEVPLAEFSARIWSLMKEYISAQQEKLLESAHEKPSLTATGIQQIWQLVNEGRGDHLLVEKGFAIPGFPAERNSPRLDLRPPRSPHKVYADVINELIANTISKGGSVSITEDDLLADVGRALLFLRY